MLQRIIIHISISFLLVIAFSAEALCFDEFDEVYMPSKISFSIDEFTLQLKGRMRIGLHDLEGKGGPGYDSPTDTQTIGTRSPFVELDAFDLAFRVHWKEMLWLNTSIEFFTTGARLSSIYFEYKGDITDDLRNGAELGYLSPIIATDRHTSRYPLLASLAWKNPEFHAAYALSYAFTSSVNLSLFLSLGMMRPLKSEPLHASPTYKGSYSIMAYGQAKSFSGNSPAATALLRLNAYALSLEAYAFIGKLSAQHGIDTLIADFPNYRQNPKHNATAAQAYFAGARLSYNALGFHFMAESLYAKEHHLQRFAYYVQASYTHKRLANFFPSVSFLMRFEQLLLINANKPLNSAYALRSPEIINAISWDYTILTLALKTQIFRDFISLRLEYAIIFEKNDVPKLKQKNLDIDNNELLLQLEARF